MKAQEIVLQQIIAGLEAGDIPRQKTRVSRGAVNLVSKKQYRWFNSMLLQRLAGKQGWSKYRLTYKQAKALGGQVKQWCKGTQVIYYTMLESKQLNKQGERDKIPLTKYYTVFNLSQCEGIEAPQDTEYDNDILPEAQATIDGYLTREKIKQVDGEPAYVPSLDTIRMPAINRFMDTNEFYHTYMHEIIHSTGAAHRLDRLKSTDNTKFWSMEYSKEELVAEVGAAILCNETAVAWSVANTQAYINSWAKYMKDKPGEVIQAFTKAMKASEYVLSIDQA